MKPNIHALKLKAAGLSKKALATSVVFVSTTAAALAEGDGTEIFTEIGTTVGILAAAAMVLMLAVQKPLVIMKLIKKFLGRGT